MGAKLVPKRGIATDFYVAYWNYLKAQHEDNDTWRGAWSEFLDVRNSYDNLTYYRESRWKNRVSEDYWEYRSTGRSRMVKGKVTNGSN